MTALTMGRNSLPYPIRYYDRLVAASSSVMRGGMAVVDLTSGKITQGQPGVNYAPAGTFAPYRDLGNIAVDTYVSIDFGSEQLCQTWVNGTAGDACRPQDIGQPCYILDDQTVSRSATGKSIAGIIFAFDANGNVIVQCYPGVISTVTPLGSIDVSAVTNGTAGQVVRTNAGATSAEWGGVLDIAKGAAGAWDAITHEMTLDPTDSGCVYTIPTTAAASKLILAATNAKNGWFVDVIANGTKNGHTVTYYNLADSAAITAALTASHALSFRAIFDGTNWVVCYATVAI